jgi:Fe2+ or Zn2+ uptake regulation protein
MSNPSPHDKPNALELPAIDGSAIKTEKITHENCHNVTAIQVYQGKNSVENIMKRRITLTEIIDDHNEKGEVYTESDLLKELRVRGFPISPRTLYRDLNEYNKNNTFVVDIAKYNYASHVEKYFKALLICLKDFEEIKNTKEIKNVRTTTREIDGKTETITTEENSGEKLKNIRIKAINGQASICNLLLQQLNGRGVITVAGNLLHGQFMEIAKQRDEAREELMKVQAENIDLRNQLPNNKQQ